MKTGQKPISSGLLALKLEVVREARRWISENLIHVPDFFLIVNSEKVYYTNVSVVVIVVVIVVIPNIFINRCSAPLV